MKILLLDNYDSFTYNLYQYIGEIMAADSRPFVLDVRRNDEITLADIRRAKYDRIIISPGPGSPDDPKYFGVCGKVLTKIGQSTPVLGVCLGMQGMAHFFGGRVIRARLPMHGKTSLIEHDGQGIFNGLPRPLEVMRYHSLVVDPTCVPKCLQVTATTLGADMLGADLMSAPSKTRQAPGEIMGLRHRHFPIQGIQFHPESFATEGGKIILRNFLFGAQAKACTTKK